MARLECVSLFFNQTFRKTLARSIRLAACLGVRLDVIEPCGFPLSDRALRRAALDYGAQAEVARHDSWAAFLAARSAARAGWCCSPPGPPSPCTDFAFQPDDMLLFGRESAGVPEEVHAAADARLVIPIRPETRSLNVVDGRGHGARRGAAPDRRISRPRRPRRVRRRSAAAHDR